MTKPAADSANAFPESLPLRTHVLTLFNGLPKDLTVPTVIPVFVVASMWTKLLADVLLAPPPPGAWWCYDVTIFTTRRDYKLEHVPASAATTSACTFWTPPSTTGARRGPTGLGQEPHQDPVQYAPLSFTSKSALERLDYEVAWDVLSASLASGGFGGLLPGAPLPSDAAAAAALEFPRPPPVALVVTKNLAAGMENLVHIMSANNGGQVLLATQWDGEVMMIDAWFRMLWCRRHGM
ncbi:hypothetical protein H9P43_004910 [Blastocladiella emersonii ATCC 22665]|nr:hypothetical protein H9P43_004910 [Blastocladiella emersonii ATCC 22665]